MVSGASGSPDSCTCTSSPAATPVERATGSGSHTPSPAPVARVSTTSRAAGSSTPNNRTGALPRSALTTGPTGSKKSLGCSSVEMVWVVTRAGPTPGISSSERSMSVHGRLSGSMPPLSRTTGAVLALAPAGTDSSARRTAASDTASAYSGPAAAATASRVSTPNIRVRVTASCSSRRGANRHTGGGRKRRRACVGAPVGTSAARLDSTVTPRSVTYCVANGAASAERRRVGQWPANQSTAV